jgi:hypothetical protein
VYQNDPAKAEFLINFFIVKFKEFSKDGFNWMSMFSLLKSMMSKQLIDSFLAIFAKTNLENVANHNWDAFIDMAKENDLDTLLIEHLINKTK